MSEAYKYDERIKFLEARVQALEKENSQLKKEHTSNRNHIVFYRYSYPFDEKIAQLADKIPLAIYETDIAGHLVYLNDAGKNALMGAGIDVTNMQDIFDFYDTKEKKKEAQHYFQEKMKGKALGPKEYVIKNARGKNIHLIIDSQPIVEKGSVIGMRGYFIDNSRQKEYEADLRYSELKHKALVDNLPDIILMHDRGVITWINQIGIDTLAYPEKEILGKTIFDFIIPEERVRIKTYMEKRYKGEDVPKEYEIRIRDSKGKILLFESRPVLFQLKEKTINLTVLTNITEKRKTENALKESQERFEIFMKNLPAMIFIKDHRSRTLYINEYSKVLFPEIKDWLDKDAKKIFAPEVAERIIKEDKIVLKGKPSNHIFTHVKNNEKKYIQTFKFLIPRGKNKPFIGGVSMDITQVKKAEEEIKLKNEELESTNEELKSLNEELIESRDLLIKANNKLQMTQETIEKSPVAMLWTDNEQKIIFTNRAAGKLFGYKQRELEQMRIFEFERGKNREQFERFLKSLSHDVSFSFETIFYNKADKEVPVELYMNKIMVNEEPVTFIFALDIAQKKHTEIKLFHSEERLKKMTENIQDGITIIENGIVIYTNNRLKQILEIPQTSDNFDLHTYFDKKTNSMIRKSMQASKKKGETTTTVEFWITTDKGNLKYLQNKYTEKTENLQHYTYIVTNDFTERKQSEEALEKEKSTLNKVIDFNPYAIIIIDKEGNLLKSNKATSDLLGDQLPKNYNLFYDQGLEKSGVIGKFIRAKTGKTIYIPDFWYNTKHIFPRKPNVTVCLRSVIFSLTDSSKNIENYVIIHEDITAYKNTEKALRESEETFRTLVETEATGILIYQGFNMVYTNNAASLITGYSKQEIQTMDFFDIVHPDYWKKIEHESFLKKTRENILIGSEIKIVTKSGQEKWIDIRGNEIFFKQKPCGLLSFFDITSRKNAEKALRTSENENRAIIEALPDVLLKISSDLIVVDYSTKEPDSFIDQEVFLNEPLSKIFSNEMLDIFTENLNALFAKKTQRNFEMEIMVKKEPRFYETRLVLLEPKIALAIIRDVTERRSTAQTIQLLNQELLRKNQELEQLIYVTSHDLRSPLINIQGFSKELERLFDESQKFFNKASNTKKEMLSGINEIIKESDPLFQFLYSSTKKMDGLLSGLLHLSRMGRTPIHIHVLNTNKVVKEIIKTFEYQINQKNINIEIDELPPVCGDEQLLNQAISNLIDNSIKFMDKKEGGLIKIWGFISSVESVLCIEDNGCGIQKEYQQKIFEIFQRLDTNTQGEGLGLNIVKKIMERHDGNIWIESMPGKGSKFYISLPLKNIEESENNDSG